MWLVETLRDPGVDARIPHLKLPPRPGVIGHRQQPIATPELLTQVTGRARRGQRTGTALPRPGHLMLPVPKRQPDQRGRGARPEVADHVQQPAYQHPPMPDIHSSALVNDAEHAPRQFGPYRLPHPNEIQSCAAATFLAQPAAVLARNRIGTEAGQAHPGRDRLPQRLQHLGPVVAHRAVPGPGLIRSGPAHEQGPVRPAPGVLRHPAVKAFQSAAARISASSVTCA